MEDVIKEEVSAVHGEKMIRLTIYLNTYAIADDLENVKKKEAWTFGSVRVDKNALHGIPAQKEIMFKRMSEIPAAIENALGKAGVKLTRPSRRLACEIPTLIPSARCAGSQRRRERRNGCLIMTWTQLRRDLRLRIGRGRTGRFQGQG